MSSLACGKLPDDRDPSTKSFSNFDLYHQHSPTFTSMVSFGRQVHPVCMLCPNRYVPVVHQREVSVDGVSGYTYVLLLKQLLLYYALHQLYSTSRSTQNPDRWLLYDASNCCQSPEQNLATYMLPIPSFYPRPPFLLGESYGHLVLRYERAECSGPEFGTS